MSRRQIAGEAALGMSSDDKGGTVRAVTRAIDILKSFDGATEPLSVADIARKTRLNRPTLYRLLNTLVEADMIDAVGTPQRFRLGHAAARLGQAWSTQLDIGALARPVLDALRDETGESASLFLLRDERQICVLESRSRHALSMSRGIGEMEDGFRGASGKVILAWLDDAHAAAVLRKQPRHVASAISKTELTDIRRKGYAISRGAVFVGALAIAAPVFDGSGAVIGSFAVYGPEARLKDERLKDVVEHVVAAAERVSNELGYRPVAPAAKR
jgi:IclR family transcriptional regulator, acetate operon repressor